MSELCIGRVEDRLATERKECNLYRAYRIVFRVRPLGVLLVLTATVAVVYGLRLLLTLNDATSYVGQIEVAESINWLRWVSIAGLLFVVGLLSNWFTMSTLPALALTYSLTIFKCGILSLVTSRRCSMTASEISKSICRFPDVCYALVK